MHQVIVIARYEGDIIVITRVRGGAKDKCNNVYIYVPVHGSAQDLRTVN